MTLEEPTETPSKTWKLRQASFLSDALIAGIEARRFVVYPPRTGAKEETFTHEAVEVAIGPENSVSLRSPRKREWQSAAGNL